MITLIVVFVLAFLFLFFNECEDESVRNNWKGRWAFLNQKGSWKRKWLIVNGETLPYIPGWRMIPIPGTKYHLKLPIQWWYFGVYPENVERFTYSSTLLVFLTDPEHSFQFAKLRALEAAVFVVNWQAGIAFFVGLRLFSLVKEKFLPSIH